MDKKQECTGGLCKPGLHSIVLWGTPSPDQQSPRSKHPTETANGTNSGLTPTDLKLCIGLIVAFVVFQLFRLSVANNKVIYAQAKN